MVRLEVGWGQGVDKVGTRWKGGWVNVGSDWGWAGMRWGQVGGGMYSGFR